MDEPEEPPAPPPAVIHSAQYDYDGASVVLSITVAGASEPQHYVLNATDPHGLSPFLRAELETMTKAGFKIAPASIEPREG